jgi:hypothetical protein
VADHAAQNTTRDDDTTREKAFKIATGWPIARERVDCSPHQRSRKRAGSPEGLRYFYL